MKQSLFFFVLLTLSFSLSAIKTLSATTGLPAPSTFTEYAAPVSYVPGLPEDNEILYGDANGDGVINVLDLIAIINYIMGGNPDPFDFEAADLNNDGTVNILDVIFNVNIIMGTPGIPCPGLPTVTYEGQAYNTVNIGEQCWFRENLNIGAMIASTVSGYLQSDNGIIEKYCYENDIANCSIYGGLYEWREAMQYVTTQGAMGICPQGWHIPSDDEWKILEGTVDSQYGTGDPIWNNTGYRGLDAGGNLKESGVTDWFAPNTGATNESGFTCLPWGARNGNSGAFYHLNNSGYFWTSSQNDESNGWYRSLGFNSAAVYRDWRYDAYGFSIRCLKGCSPQPTQSGAGPDQLNLPGTSTTLAGNTPTSGTGMWEIVNGTGGTITSPANPTSTFQGQAGNEYTLSWTITTICGSSTDQVAISFAEAGFICGDAVVDSRDGQSYETVLIGTQCWMAENINIGIKINSNTVGYLQMNNGIFEKYCYNNDIAQCETYGGLYEWPEAMQYVTTVGAQGICPAGWHLPTDGEWTILTDFLGGEAIAGGKMKSTGTIEDGTGLWYEPNEGATNESGFTGFPGGNRDRGEGDFWDLGLLGYFWSSSQDDTDNAWLRTLTKYYTDVTRYADRKDNGFSVRCLKD